MTNQKRECGDCNMCCKVYSIDSGLFEEDKTHVFKKDYEWCKHCEKGVGCKIYEKRPSACSDFKCGWLMGVVPEEWKPNKVGFVVTVEKEESLEHKVFTVYADSHKVHNIHKHLKNYTFKDQDGAEWHYVIRYDGDENNMAVFDKKRFGDELQFCKRGEL